MNKKFIGLRNYSDILRNTEFYNSLYITIIYTILVTIGSIIIALFLANILNKGLKFTTFFRTVYFIPVITATSAAGIVWKYMLDPSQGIVNKFLNFIHLPSVSWLTNPFWALISISIVGIWKRIGYNMIIYLAAMQSISPSLYESADIDGATSFRKFKSITVPLLKPTTLLLVIMCFIDSFQVFDIVYVMTNGGPMGASDVLGLYMYREGFASSNIGYASAVGWVIFLFVFIATIIQFKISSKGEAM
ncbi:sugar ABC transporter permease [Clostridium sp. C2-6-12]|uniref:carbohydrate ABC transporter permease n=1 Tax=Clostridium sp. C2-6-12 TaxID=2698832 RepID=UPI0013680545|nr:sugar ABC transporter permease [Clostridium sp. C2-6-12]